jgi:hypothetical protein
MSQQARHLVRVAAHVQHLVDAGELVVVVAVLEADGDVPRGRILGNLGERVTGMGDVARGGFAASLDGAAS